MKALKKTALVGVLGISIVIGMASASTLNNFGVINGEASVEPAVEVVEIYSDTKISQNYGEYVIFKNNFGSSLILEEWKIEQGGETVLDEGDISTTDSDFFAIVDGRNADHLSEDVEIIDIDDPIVSSISADDDIMELIHIQSGSVIQEADYEGCEDEKSYNVSAGECQNKTLEVNALE